MATRPQPLSPHLSVYRFTLTMTMSIVHRITGIALYAGTILLVAWIGAAALGDGAYNMAQAVFGHWFGQIVLIGYTWALLHHMLGGIRHFIWDSGNGLGHPAREWLAIANLACSILLTLTVWTLFAWTSWLG